MIETIQAFFSNWLTSVADILPLGFAFGAGMVSTVNPCGFVMLPTFVGLYMGADDPEYDNRPPVSRIGSALAVSAAMGLGFVVLFGLAGSVVAAGGNALVTVMPWAGLIIGTLLLATGIAALSGRKIYSNAASQWSSKIGGTTGRGFSAYFMFGLAFAVASLSCTLPIFLTVVGSSIIVSGYVEGMAQFILYALGMGFVVMALTLSVAVFKGAVGRGLKRVMPYVDSASTALLIAAGGYIIYYWLIKADLIGDII